MEEAAQAEAIAQEQVNAAQVEESEEFETDSEKTGSCDTEDSEWDAECDDRFQKVQEELVAEIRQVEKEDRLQWLAAWHFNLGTGSRLGGYRSGGIGATGVQDTELE